MSAWRVITLVLCLFVPAQFGGALAQDSGALRLALVVGNANYRDVGPPLTASAADAAMVGAELKRLGYAVDLAEDTTQADLMSRTERLLREVRAGARIVVYFNGYAIQSGRQNYLIPIDGNIWSETDVQKFGLNLGQLVSELNRRGAADTYVIVEGAVRNPYERRFRRFSTGLAPVATLPPGTTLMLSAPPGAVLNPPTGERGPLAAELVKQVAADRDVSPQTLEKVRTTVVAASSDGPGPWILSTRTTPPPAVSSGPEPSKKPDEPSKTAGPETPKKPDEPSKSAGPDVPKKPDEPSKAAGPDTPVAGGNERPAQTAEPKTEPTPEKPKIAVLPYSAADEKALKDLDAAIERNPRDLAALYTRGQTYALHYDFAKALADFDRVLKINPTEVESLNNRCWIKAIIDDLDAAIADCNAALKLRPEFLDALDSRGFVMLKIGLPRRAIGDYDAALRISERHVSSLYGRGLARQRLGEKASAERDIKLALSIDPKIGEQFSLFGVK